MTYKRVKFARLKVDKEANITMSLPIAYPKKLVFSMLETHKKWLKERLEAVKKTQLPKGQIWFLGEIYTLEFDENLKIVQVYDKTILAPNLTKFEKFKKEFARAKFDQLIDKFSPCINRVINSLTVRKMKSRWGSCNSKKGYINLNLHLIEKDERFIEYVVLHELTHLIYPHHKREFYDFIAQIMPDFKDRVKLVQI